ncbi:type II secretion system protein K (GspK) [Bradyrhizobium lablabi]|uniref:Type II secretion system protein K (GspK) n=2 Tax=Bradyrhizobium TaxID=374 RepID=A0ABY0Q6U5_9BRAD|nr:type II secretion system protein K (GspK) [Bradyrhizobium ottawaense]SEC37924.1 type II secretion system protein K (GspK) [Bradyrhizobium lablabi]
MTDRLTVPPSCSCRARVGVRRLLPYFAGNRRGFALVAVIWSLALITLLGMAVMVGARYRTRVAANYASAATAETAAESAVNLGLSMVLNRVAGPDVRFPLRCQLPGGEHIFVTVEEETGKIDLNTASIAVLTRFFTALTRDPSAGARIAGKIIEPRKPKKDVNSGPENAPPGATFTTIMQLDQIDGITPRIFRAASRFVTVRSGRPEPDMEAASPALRRLLNLDQKTTSAARGVPAAGSITIRADVTAPDGARFIREALVSLADAGRPYVIREWRHGDVDQAAQPQLSSRDEIQAPRRPCFRTVDAAASEGA